MTINWKRTLIGLLDVVIAVYLVAAVTVLNKPYGKAAVCSEVNITIADGQANSILTPAEVKRLLEQHRAYPLAQPMQFIDTRHMEEVLSENPFVANAECYKTQEGHIAIHLVQRKPVLYVLSTTGDRYFVDSEGEILPHTRLTSNLLVATGTITRQYASSHLAPIARFINDDRFWKEQTEQLNVLPDGNLELIPRVGSHIVSLGAPVGIDRKLDRLLKFYKYGLSHAGWDRYERISVEYDNQIVCKKKKSRS
jgi:cell division protein FtsQ